MNISKNLVKTQAQRDKEVAEKASIAPAIPISFNANLIVSHPGIFVTTIPLNGKFNSDGGSVNGVGTNFDVAKFEKSG